MHKHNLTGDEINLVASLLAKLEPGYLPEPIFDQAVRLVVCSTIVIVPLKKTPRGLAVLLRPREKDRDDPVWPGFWHLPGTMLRPSDKEGDYSDAFGRLLLGEIGTNQTSSSLTFVRTAFTKTKRGPEHTQLYYMLVDGEEPAGGRFFPIDKLPKPIIEHEVGYIKEAAKLAAGRFFAGF